MGDDFILHYEFLNVMAKVGRQTLKYIFPQNLDYKIVKSLLTTGQLNF